MKCLLYPKKAIYILMVTMLLLVASTNMVFADSGTPPTPPDAPSEPVVIRQGDPVIHKEIAIPLEKSLGPLSVTDVYRAGWTDAYWEWFYPVNVEHHGSHNSQSDLVENQIWADGSLNVDGSNVHSCSDHKSGQFAGCVTTKVYYLPFQITATSWHFFQKTGFTDQNFSTSKTVTP